MKVFLQKSIEYNEKTSTILLADVYKSEDQYEQRLEQYNPA